MEGKKVIELIDADIYQRDALILSDVNLEVNEGEFVYITGKVGTGKSSLIKVLNAELPLQKGTGEIAGFNLKNIKHKEVSLLRRKLGVVFQDFRLLPDRNVFQNLEFVLKATGWKNKTEIQERIDQVLRQVGMTEKKQKMPHQLSGGEQQRVVIARAILNNPPIILADEPTGNLDPETSSEIMNLFRDLNNDGKTIMMATHDFAAIANKPARTLVCAHGLISDSLKQNVILDFESLLGF
ncbi:cell division transport system ATP-binding protein [Mariniphaga anaerophila]|uniref:Cell division ATP-binding protein FtsE n=1 Tax=Mariniphaga anaerophila TaxID=1484053 RepID=A0A1M5AJA5_9BACT|nr:ATP-binding cassette domain-containing protein [Mariniphaga anaerophila]SHF30214.1 cell division transport system ATP-binding protein [Mariniphaga anaerophila]